MKKYNILILITFILTILISCGGNKDCPLFDRDLLVWIPYENGDVIKFVNTKNDTISFNVSEKEIYDHIGKVKHACFSEVTSQFIIDVDSSMYYKIYNECEDCITFDLGIAINDKRGCFSLKTNNIKFNIIKDTIIDNHNYINIIEIKTDPIKYPNLTHYWKIIIAENKGIVKFYDRIDNEVWTFID